MTEDVIERYEIFNTKVCPYELVFGDFNYQQILPRYYNWLKDDNGDENDIPGNLVDDVLPDNKVV